MKNNMGETDVILQVAAVTRFTEITTLNSTHCSKFSSLAEPVFVN